MRIEDIRESLVIRERDLFLLTDITGRVPRGNPNGYGLYSSDTRYLSGYELSFSMGRAICLLSTAELGYSSEQVLTNASMTDADDRQVPQGTIEVHRTRAVQDVLEETLEVRNYNQFPVALDLVYRFSADFADIFVVRGFEPEQHGKLSPPAWKDGALVFRYKGADGHNRQTTILFTPKPTSVQVDPDIAFATFRVELDSQGSAVLRLVITVDGRLEAPQGAARFAITEREYKKWMQKTTQIRSDNEFFNAVLNRSLMDLRMLWHHEQFEGGYPAAGTPWYDTLFGRDTAIAGLQTISMKPDFARQCIAALARHQGKKFDSWQDEEPGKILHELRVGELTLTGELPFSPYYGSVDSTPLFLILAGEYFRWTADLTLMRQIETNLRAALHWLERYGDPDGDGYVEYEKRSSRGLVNQGWKDSEDSMVHADGTPMKPPIHLVEVQAYVYAGCCSLAGVFSALGDETTAAGLREKARDLRERFGRDFWLPNGLYALALDGENVPAASVSSNGGHALWCGIASAENGEAFARRVMKKDMFSGWGVRTLSTDHPRYNPQAYHNGTVWPHDNSILVMGLKRYGQEKHLNQIATGLFEAAQSFPYYRLPELFGGSGRSAHRTPVPYPVACRPQAWAAGAFPLITQAILGLHADAPHGRLLVVRPELPDWLHAVSVAGLRVGRAEADLFYERVGDETSVEVLDTRGDLQVELVDSWPED